jgi:hypothetical protein
VIDSPEAAGRALGELFLALGELFLALGELFLALGELFLGNADRGDDAANDDLVAELVRRIRAQQDFRDGGRPVVSATPLTPAGRRLSSPAPLPLLAASRTPAPGPKDPVAGRCGGHATPTMGACTYCSPPRSLLPPPGATPTRSAGAPFRRKVSPLAHGSVAALCLTCLTATRPHEEQSPPQAHRPAVDRPSASPEVTPHHASPTTTTRL